MPNSDNNAGIVDKDVAGDVADDTKPVAANAVRTVQTQHGDFRTVDEENIVVLQLSRCESPVLTDEQIAAELVWIQTDPLGRDEVSWGELCDARNCAFFIATPRFGIRNSDYRVKFEFIPPFCIPRLNISIRFLPQKHPFDCQQLE